MPRQPRKEITLANIEAKPRLDKSGYPRNIVFHSHFFIICTSICLAFNFNSYDDCVTVTSSNIPNFHLKNPNNDR